MLSKLNVPKTIRVGFQHRGDTYTKKLAYVIYYDSKGKLRKEPSFEGWRHKVGQDIYHYDYEAKQQVTQVAGDEFEPINYENIPTEGFVLNKKVGGYSGGWNSRATYCRVYDPRGFEFEINIVNLLFILQETNSIKGKGLEGEFVYAWDGKDVILLPVGCQEYKDSVEFTSLKTKKVTKSEMKEGFTYLTKNQEEVIYLGRHKWYEKGYEVENKHVFIKVKNVDDDYNELKHFILTKGFTDLASVVISEEVHNYAEIYDKFAKCKFSSKVLAFESTDFKYPDVPVKFKNRWDTLPKSFIQVNDKEYVEVQIKLEFEYVKHTDYDENYYKTIGYIIENNRRFSIGDDGTINTTYINRNHFNRSQNMRSQHKYDNGGLMMDMGKLKHIEFKKLEVRLESGSLIDINKY